MYANHLIVEEVGIVAAAGVAVLTLCGLIFHYARRAGKALEWFHDQMEANGVATANGTESLSWRDMQDLFASQLAQQIAALARLEQNQNTISENQSEQRQQLAHLSRTLDDHLVESSQVIARAGEAVARLDAHLAAHEDGAGHIIVLP